MYSLIKSYRKGGDKNMEDKNNESKNGRGFASMDPAKQQEIASKGGKAAHEKGTAHEYSPEEAREAGQKGGSSPKGEEERNG